MSYSKRILFFKVNKQIIVKTLDKKLYRIGRNGSSDISLNFKGISRVHASVYFSDDSFWIIDGELKGKPSTNGLKVNGQSISIKKLEPFDSITFIKGISAIFLEFEGDALSGNAFEDSVKSIALFVSGKYTKRSNTSDQKTPIDFEKDTLTRKRPAPQFDDLTKLPTRNYFLNRVERSIIFNSKVSSEQKFAVLFIDVDRFKMVNDSLGHEAGDYFLIQLTKRFKASVRPGDTIARIGGDEFAILLDHLQDFSEATAVAKRLQSYMATPLQIGNQKIYPSISVGIASSDLGYESTAEIMRDADTAMYQAKDAGRGRFVVFDKAMHEKAKDLLKLHGDLRKALENQEFHLCYQPIVSLKEKQLAGFEALIRWHHPERGLISPEVFIPIAEESDLICKLGMWILDEACRQLSLWQDNEAIDSELTVNVNLSSKQLRDTNLINRVRLTLGKHKISPSSLKLEVTENIVMENTQHSIEVFNQLRALGVQLAIDDFGTGYSSLSYLNRFPIDTLKVDRSFVSKVNTPTYDSVSVNITNSIIGLAHSLGVKVVAEGVEELYHLMYLKHMECDYAQGYLFSKPLHPEKATSLAEKGLDWIWRC